MPPVVEKIIASQEVYISRFKWFGANRCLCRRNRSMAWLKTNVGAVIEQIARRVNFDMRMLGVYLWREVSSERPRRKYRLWSPRTIGIWDVLRLPIFLTWRLCRWGRRGQRIRGSRHILGDNSCCIERVMAAEFEGEIGDEGWRMENGMESRGWAFCLGQGCWSMDWIFIFFDRHRRHRHRRIKSTRSKRPGIWARFICLDTNFPY